MVKALTMASSSVATVKGGCFGSMAFISSAAWLMMPWNPVMTCCKNEQSGSVNRQWVVLLKYRLGESGRTGNGPCPMTNNDPDSALIEEAGP